MSNNVFDKIGDIRNNVNRSTFDWSHDNNFTTGLGRIIPVFCELCPPNSALRIKPEFGLQFMPMMFPVQTKMKSYLSFYRVPLRTLWKDYMNFISSPQDSTYEPPYIQFPANSFDEGGALGISSLADYLGIPVTSVQPAAYLNLFPAASEIVTTAWESFLLPSATSSTVKLYPSGQATTSTKYRALPPSASIPSVGEELDLVSINDIASGGSGGSKPATGPYVALFDPSHVFYTDGGHLDPVRILGVSENDVPYDELLYRTLNFTIRFTGGGDTNTLYYALLSDPSKFTILGLASTGDGSTNVIPGITLASYDSWTVVSSATPVDVRRNINSSNTQESYIEIDFSLQMPFYFEESDVSTSTMKLIPTLAFVLDNDFDTFRFFKQSSSSNVVKATISAQSNVSYQADSLCYTSLTNTGVGTAPLTKETCPYSFAGGSANQNLKISAYPFRAYEAIYNAYTRNTRNNPFVVDGKPVYNRWITNNDGGADSTTPLNLRRANWASDMYVTALTAPQQGTAPLVGITTYTEQTALENGHVETKVRTALVDEDGNKYAVNFESNDEELKGVTYTQLNADTPVRPVSNLYDLVTSGISINDFRNVNAYQRYLELNQFRGFKYKDIVEGRFDVQVRYDELDMPEYLGGITRDVIVNPVTQTVETSDTGTYQGALGSQSGLAGVRGSTDQTISCFCDEESLVIGLLSVVPMPIYTQVLPKHFLYRERLDSFNPEFDHIGYQPIGFSELCPVLDYVQNGKNTNGTFGYQRPWYEYCQKLDTAHGLFRTQLRNFLINRVFDSVPQLGASFTTIDEADVNNVFSVTETTDKIYGQIHFDVSAKLPISRVVVPKLE